MDFLFEMIYFTISRKYTCVEFNAQKIHREAFSKTLNLANIANLTKILKTYEKHYTNIPKLTILCTHCLVAEQQYCRGYFGKAQRFLNKEVLDQFLSVS